MPEAPLKVPDDLRRRIGRGRARRGRGSSWEPVVGGPALRAAGCALPVVRPGPGPADGARAAVVPDRPTARRQSRARRGSTPRDLLGHPAGHRLHGRSFELMQMFGDDIAFRSGTYQVGPSQLAQMFYVLGRAGSGRSAPTRVRAAAGIILAGAKNVEASFLAHTVVTAEVARGVGLDAGVGEALSATFARWDVKGVPRGIAGDRRLPVLLPWR
jgi:hypothetical protein